MARATKTNERAVLDSLLESFPGFLQGGLSWMPGPEPPDFIATSAAGQRLGLEMTEWLNEGQTSLSISNQDSRFKLLKALDSEHSDCPKPLTRVIICDRLDVPFRTQDRAEYVREVYRFINDHAPEWHANDPIGIWKVSNLSGYPVLTRYCHCIALYGPRRLVTTPSGLPWNGPGNAWIQFEPVGGVYDPKWSANALQLRIQAKTCKYSGIHHEQKLKHFALLVHFGIRGIVHNTPYKGRNARLEDAAIQAHRCLLIDRGAFDSAYLYMNFNGGKLIKLFPEFVTLKEYSHQPGQH